MTIMDTLKKYKWIVPLISKADRKIKAQILKNLASKEKNFYPEGEYKADVKNLINCMLCPNMCRFDCGSLQAAQTETMSPAFKSRIGYFLSLGKINPSLEENKAFVDLIYKCTSEENCKIWCPFDFSVVSLLETVREDLNGKDLMPDYCKKQIEKLKKTNTIEEIDIFKTYREKGIENIETNGNDEVYYYIGCQSMKFPNMVNAYIQILKKAGVNFSTNLEKKTCCGAPAFNIRDLSIGKELANKNKDIIESTGAKIIISDCPGCVETLTKRYKKEGIELQNVEIYHIARFVNQLIKKGKLTLKKQDQDQPNSEAITIHDPCHLARNQADTTSIREIINIIPNIKLVEPICNKENTHCCGWSGTLHWADKNIALKEASLRINELKETGASIILSACPLCELGLEHGLDDIDKEKIQIMDISEMLLKSL